MKFVLVNHRTPLSTATCTECAQALGSGYLREVATQRQYCDYDCYLRYETKSLFMPWLKAGRSDAHAATPYGTPFELIGSFAAASCWYSISFAKAALRVVELVAAEISGLERPRK